MKYVFFIHTRVSSKRKIDDLSLDTTHNRLWIFSKPLKIQLFHLYLLWREAALLYFLFSCRQPSWQSSSSCLLPYSSCLLVIGSVWLGRSSITFISWVTVSSNCRCKQWEMSAANNNVVDWELGCIWSKDGYCECGNINVDWYGEKKLVGLDGCKKYECVC